MTKVAFVGLGVMGYPMAGHLKNGGHDVTVYNRTTATAEKWVAEYGGASAPTPRHYCPSGTFSSGPAATARSSPTDFNSGRRTPAVP